MTGYIYFLYKDNALLYIGQTTNIISRISNHFSFSIYDKVRLIECDIDKLKHYEYRLIKYFKPSLNTVYNSEYKRSNVPFRKGNNRCRIKDFPELQKIREMNNLKLGKKTYRT